MQHTQGTNICTISLWNALEVPQIHKTRRHYTMCETMQAIFGLYDPYPCRNTPGRMFKSIKMPDMSFLPYLRRCALSALFSAGITYACAACAQSQGSWAFVPVPSLHR